MSIQNWSDLDALYNDDYHAAWLDEARRSAAVVVPLLIELFPWVISVVDVGCSTGVWLHEFRLLGVSRVLGLDGSSLSPGLLQVDSSEFRRVDFREPFPSLGRFDLAISLEVGDCLPDEAAQHFVTSLTSMSDLIVFSAAVPGQSVQPTMNERWPSYWVTLFAANGFVCFDILRTKLWYDQRVNWPYAQNILVFASESREDLLNQLCSISRGVLGALDIVHPKAFEFFRGEASLGDSAQLKLYPFRLIEEGYEGYNILQIDVDRFLALAQREGAYSPEKLAAGGYEQAYVGGSAEEVKARIPRAFPVKLIEEGYEGYNILQIDVDKFLALAQSEGVYSPEKLAAGGYKQAYVAGSVDQLRTRVGRRVKEESSERFDFRVVQNRGIRGRIKSWCSDRQARPFILLLCATIWAIGLPWHLLNHRVPIWDEAAFVADAQQITASFHHSWVEGFQALYLVRGWRPIIFPAVAAPFFALAHGDIIVAPGLTQLFCLSLIALYAFLLLLQFLTRARALVGAMFVVTAPWLFNFSYSFYSEVFWMGGSLGWAFHLLVGVAKKSRTHLLIAGLWLGVMSATRPAETVLIALLPLSFVIVRSAVRREVSPIDIIVFLTQGILMCVAVWKRIQVASTEPLVWALLALCLLLVAARWRQFFLRAPILGLASVAEFVCVAWYLPSLPALYAWAYETSFGPLAKLSVWARFADRSPATLWDWFVSAYNPKPLAYIIVLAVVALAMPGRFHRLNDATRAALRVIALSVLMLVPVVAILLISGTNDWRRSMPEILTFYVGAVGLALVPTAALPGARLGAVMLLVLAQTLAAGANGLNVQWAVQPPLANWVGTYRPPFVGKDDNVAFITDLHKLGLTKGRFSAYTICYRDPIVGCSRRGIPWFEVEGATAVARQEQLPMYINMARDLDFSKPDTLAAQLKQRDFNFVVVDTFYQPDQVVQSDPIFEHSSQFIAMVKSGLHPGFKEVGKFAFGDRDLYVLAVE